MVNIVIGNVRHFLLVALGDRRDSEVGFLGGSFSPTYKIVKG